MTLKELIKNLGDCQIGARLKDFGVQGISCNSKSTEKNFIFVAVKGVKEDGTKFIDEAINNGARAIISQSSAQGHKAIGGVNFILVKDSRKALAKLAAQFWGRPSRKLKVIGITGTNGKTTVSYLLESILKEAGFNPAVIGTINYRFADKVIASKNTTPGPLELQKILADMLKKKVHYAVMEVSSHALDQARVQEIDFHSAIFTNLTQDHLDYHKTLGRYFQAKARLFSNVRKGSFAVINNDDTYARKLKGLTKAKVITYGIDTRADVMAKDIKQNDAQTEFIIEAACKRQIFKTSLIGRHNVYNILTASAWGIKEGLKLSVIKSAIEKFCFVPGRLERIESGRGFSVYVDYAHTEDALKNVLNSLRQLTKARIIVVFGCGGERDETKRPKMGRVVSQLADFAVITSDNPRSEDPIKIIADIKKGIKSNNYVVIPGRKEAIKKSLSLARAGDIVLVAGKGHENYQILKDRVVHFDDRKAVRQCLRSISC